MAWHQQRLCAFDLESTGKDRETARIVSACIALVGDGKPAQVGTWISDVDGQEIPEEAAKVHGITTERARAEGQPARDVIEQITAALSQAQVAGIPIVAMNARYDLTLTDREARRHDVPPLVEILGIEGLRVIDPYVLDKQVDRFRRGKRTLTHLCEHYQVTLDAAHSADADAIAAARIAWRMGETYPALRDLDLDELHKWQIVWAAEQAASLQEYFRSQPGRETEVVEPAWPLVPIGGAR